MVTEGMRGVAPHAAERRAGISTRRFLKNFGISAGGRREPRAKSDTKFRGMILRRGHCRPPVQKRVREPKARAGCFCVCVAVPGQLVCANAEKVISLSGGALRRFLFILRTGVRPRNRAIGCVHSVKPRTYVPFNRGLLRFCPPRPGRLRSRRHLLCRARSPGDRFRSA